VIPTIISQIATGSKAIKLGDLTPTRDFNFVMDTCHGFELLSRCDAAIGQTVNISSNFEISIADTLDLIRSLMNSNVEFISDTERLRPAASEVFRLWGDNQKMVQLTGFKPSTDLAEGLKLTIDWFCQPQFLARYKAEQYNK
jgi:nucleoside-diphosphate-sugar epimerase